MAIMANIQDFAGLHEGRIKTRLRIFLPFLTLGTTVGRTYYLEVLNTRTSKKTRLKIGKSYRTVSFDAHLPDYSNIDILNLQFTAQGLEADVLSHPYNRDIKKVLAENPDCPDIEKTHVIIPRSRFN